MHNFSQTARKFAISGRISRRAIIEMLLRQQQVPNPPLRLKKTVSVKKKESLVYDRLLRKKNILFAGLRELFDIKYH